MELFGKLGIDVRLLIAQLINFAVLLFVLKKFLYRPVLDVLERRRRQVLENEEKEHLLATRLVEVDALCEEKLTEAERRGSDLVRSAAEEAARLRTQLLEESRVDALRLRAAAEKALAREREEALASVAREGEALVRSGVERVLSSIADRRTTELYLEKAEKELASIQMTNASK
ncbi:MAG: ATP synthase F0 subunit B [bacterium]|nr:ATP synthase F0 subunit B [bacterium]